MNILPVLLLTLLPVVMPAWAGGDIRVRDDAGREVMLHRPAQRIVSLAPHATELLFAAGGGGRVVGVVEYSDWPAAARVLPRVGDNRGLDLERIAALKPDLIVSWTHGSSARQLERLAALGVPVFQSEPRTLEQVATSLERLGRLLGSETKAQPVALQFRQRVEKLRRAHARRPPVRLFYQVWDQPLMTLNGRHLVGEVMRLCGGENPFAGLPGIAPVVDREAVLASNPELLLTAGLKHEVPQSLLAWKAWPGLLAVQRDNLFVIHADHIDRPGPRIIDGAEAFCAVLEQVRQRRP